MNKLVKVVTVFIVIIIFLFSLKSIASEPSIIISELAWMGTEISSSDEWIELKNNTENDIDLTGWMLEAQDGSPLISLTGIITSGGYFLLERTNDDSAPNISADQIYSGALSNNGEVLELRNADNNIVDSINASDGWPAGDNSTKQTMEKNNSSWQNSQSAGGTPGAQNSSETNSIPESDPEIVDSPASTTPDTGDEDETDATSTESVAQETESSTSTAIVLINKIGDVVINEFVSDPADEQVEFVELYNRKNKEINLDGWIIEEGSGAKTKLDDKIAAYKFFVIEKPKGNLNNKGDIIILRDNNNVLIDKVSYGNWSDGNLNDNAPVASDPYSIARKFDGHNTYNNANDFSLTTIITKGEVNIINNVPSAEGLSEGTYDYSENIIISEIFPNPYGPDTEDEFIELLNIGDQDINLQEWVLGDNSKKRFKILDQIIKPGKYLAIYRTKSKIALNNSFDSVKLFQPFKDEVYLEVEYEKALDDWSYNYKKDNNEWIWSEVVTPEQENIIKSINHAPVIDFYFPDIISVVSPTIFDSSDTVDDNGDELTYFWDFDDGFTNVLANPEHTYFTPGVYTIKLTVSDGENKVSKEKVIQVIEKDTNQTIISSSSDDIQILITEIMPNPIGSDTDEEWIEIYNSSTKPVNLLDWLIDDEEGGSKPYKIKNDILLESNQYYLIDREDSKIGLNNTGDKARIFNNFDKLIDQINYEKAYEGESYARGKNGEWFWTTIVTPGKDNYDPRSKSRTGLLITNDELIYGNKEYISDQVWIDPIDALEHLDNQYNLEEYVDVNIEKVKDYILGVLVKVEGVVAVLPGVLGSQYFYIVEASGVELLSRGIQIYNYKKEFPSLRVGDKIEVSGELAISSGEMRIKTKTINDFKILSKNEEPLPQVIKSEQVNEDSVGSLVKITGEVVEQKGSSVYLDDGDGEVLVYIKSGTGISAKSLKEGGKYAITGIISKTKSGIRILPRFNDDILKKDVESSEEKRQMPGQILDEDSLIIAPRDKKLELFQYLLTISVGIIVVLVGMLLKIRKT